MPPMTARLREVELFRVRLPLVAPFRSAHGIVDAKEALLVRVTTDAATGWGECAAEPQPSYSPETIDSARLVLRDHLLPHIFGLASVDAESVGVACSGVTANRMAKACIEMALLDAELRATDASLARHLGGVRDRVECGVALGMHDDVGSLCDAIDSYVAQGYRRVKLKIAPGADIEVVRAARERVGSGFPLQVDANGSYALGDARHLAGLDDFGLVMLEQPLAADRLLEHADLARVVATPLCLDETITSAAVAADALRIGACRVVNVKPGRVGGLLEALRIHDLCAGQGTPLWCGGMLDTGIGRAANVALASLPGFTLPGDLSPSDRYFHEDLTEPFVMRDGHLEVPNGPGLGVSPLPDVLRRHTVARETLHP